MKKHRKHLNTTTTTKPATTTRTPKFLTTRRFCRKRLATVRSVFYNLHKKPAPVYIDRLFKEPPCEFVGHLKPQIAYKSRSEKRAKIRYPVGEEQVQETSTRGGGSDRPSSSDDVWESVELGSPQMQGIDARAEEFIAKFRQEMAAQENMLARNL